MKKLILTFAVLAASIGAANAHPAKHHVACTSWQANAAAMQKTPQSFSMQRASVYGTSVPTGETFSQFDDH